VWAAATPIGPAGAAVTSLWQVGDRLEVASGVLNASGALPTVPPPGATHGIVVVADQPLAYQV
jgi:hypothetical protein